MSIGEALNVSATGFIVVLIVLALLACIIVVLSKVIRSFSGEKKNVQEKKEDSPTPVVASVVETPVVSATQTAQVSAVPSVVMSNGLTLYKTSEKTAATIMAIVSHESGIPLNRLDFKSIKLDDSLELYKTDDKTAATIMAIISHQTEIPLDRLVFKSIKLVENN